MPNFQRKRTEENINELKEKYKRHVILDKKLSKFINGVFYKATDEN